MGRRRRRRRRCWTQAPGINAASYVYHEKRIAGFLFLCMHVVLFLYLWCSAWHFMLFTYSLSLASTLATFKRPLTMFFVAPIPERNIICPVPRDPARLILI